MEKLVSAIITTHNRQDLLIRAVKSVFTQTYKNIELIVVDDASNERADELLKAFHLRYLYIPKEESKGGNHARNLGILAAKGDYIAFLDDDDYWLSTYIEKMVNLIEEKKTDIVYCAKRYEIINKDGVTYKNEVLYHEGDMSRKIMQNSFTSTSCILVKKETLIGIGLFDEKLRFWQDYDLMIRIAQISPFYFINEPLVVYRDDKKEKQRISNQYNNWKKNVDYIHSKYKPLYRSLSWKEKLYSKQFTWRNARLRCKTSGLYFKYFYYNTLLYATQIPSKIKGYFNTR